MPRASPRITFKVTLRPALGFVIASKALLKTDWVTHGFNAAGVYFVRWHAQTSPFARPVTNQKIQNTMSTADYSHAVTNPSKPFQRLIIFFLSLLMLAGMTWPLQSSAAQLPDNTAQRQEVVFIEGDVADYPVLLRGISQSTEKFVLNAGANGLQEMARLLKGHAPVDAIHLVSHGANATLQLGTLSLTPENLPLYSEVLAAIGGTLKPGGDILLYGCEVADGTQGSAFITTLAQATRANVAASTNPTGSAALGGDWRLEFSHGAVKTSSLHSKEYAHLLASGTISFTGNPGSSTATDGSGGSTDISGITIQISGNLGQNWTYETPYTKSGIAQDYLGSTPSSLITIKSSTTAAPFWFKSIDLIDYGGADVKVEGFRNSVSTGSVNLTTNTTPWEFTFNSGSGLTAAIFNNVDEVRITPQVGGQMWIALNNIAIDNAVFPAPTATTGSASSITAAGAALNGTINDNGATTTVTFDYGLTTGYGTNVAATTGGTVSAGAGATAASVAITGLTCNTTYHFRVKGSNSGGTTNGADNTFATSACVPGAPTGVSASAGDASATVNFTAPASNGGAAITIYTATANPGGATGTCAGPAACAIGITGLINGTAYTFSVTATNSAGTGSASSASGSVTPKSAQTITFANPGAQNFGTTPTLTATATSSLAVSFSSSTTGVCTVTSGGALTFVTAGTCTINADQAGNGVYAAATQVSQSFTVNAIVPGAPTIGTATAGDTQASVTFSAPASTGGASITGYTVTASPGGFTATGASSPLTVTGLTNGAAYTFTVTATNSAGTGGASAASNSVTPKAAQTITFANPGAQNFGTTPTLTATSTSSLTVSFTSSTTGVCTITSGGALTFLTTGTCTINADQAGNSSFLAATQVSRSFTVNAVVPGAPTVGTASPGDTQATVTFAAPAFNGGSTITGYTVTSNPGGITATGAASPITVTGLTNGVAYTFTVTATNIAGTGSASAASNSATPNPGPAVVSVAVPANGTYRTGQNLDFTVTWDQSTTVTGTPRIALTIGVTTVQANYVSSPTATTTLFRYTVQAGQTDADGISVGALTLNGGTVQNGVGTNATLTLNSVGSTASVLVDTTAPTLPAANIVVNNQADPHKVVLTFSENLDPASLGSAGAWTVTANGGTPSHTVAGVALSSGKVVTLTLNAVDVTNSATTITNTAANAHLKVTPPANLTDTAGNAYAAGLVAEAGATHVLDATPPTLSAVAASAPTTTGGSLAATASEKALGYWIAVPPGSAAPTVAQAKAGVNYGVVTAASHGSGAMAAGSVSSLALTGLSASTAYDIYLVADDAAGNPSAAASMATLTTAAAPNPVSTLTNQPTVPGVSGQPTVLDMRAGNAPAIAGCVTDTIRQALGGTVVYLGQSASGATQYSWNGQIISFYPLDANTTDARTNGIHTLGVNPLDVVSSCGTLNVAPAVYSLSELGTALAGLGFTAQINQQGVITVNANGTIYVVRPDFVVTPGDTSHRGLYLGDDGLFRFTDSNGNTQIMRPAFLDPGALQNVLSSTFSASMTLQLDGTVLVSQGGKLFILTADQTLTAVGQTHASDLWWLDGTPARYFYRVTTTPYTQYGQGISLASKSQ